MSVVAWDGQTMAADSAIIVNNSVVRTARKIFRARGYLFGYAGSAEDGSALSQWFYEGAKADDFPALRNTDVDTELLVICPRASIYIYTDSPTPLKLPPQQYAIGSGQNFAYATMYLGHSAKRAVEVAIHLDTYCNGEVNVLSLEATA